ncbi:helix-turn-helix domain protein [Clostridium argentinense CDC 2741]|uniref:Helix-turn-helix domain protein n=1 Tax=Clostridium argentinense CDC 2741 TaxID=1418104 RepID=A0A0C1UDQ9_9CLOT|nr:helix-turn-helix domain-containing protein [Clostridium argentinense]KIE45550.1 helix-turn-helix domain protein [Clostridium argentinense CDC 2741]NFF38443.1 helix-turn-helix domain-containing protein [Clostridium argentinense]NFP49363.1 helix-turn-helix domain-containing protein [Clostridium argentinense]NFP71766.1 helix-turn-helix domain-containing protein [Clostridium argentinense]NFP76648.1 helix-turn-helix domain-containing protein [Clostridium argentinense]
MEYKLSQEMGERGSAAFFTESLAFQNVIENGEHFLKPNPRDGEGFIYQVNPSPGLFLSISNWTPYSPIYKTYQLNQRRIEIYLIESGKISLIQNDKKTFDIPAGVNVYFNKLAKGRIYFENHRPIQIINILILEDYISRHLESQFSEDDFNFAETFNWKTQHYNTPEVTLLFQQIKQKLLSFEKSRLYYESKIGELLSIIASNFLNEKHKIEKAVSFVSTKDLKQLELVKSAIDKNIINPPDITELCNIAAIGQTKLRESFKAAYHMTIGEYIRLAKMRHSLILLSNSELKIQNIAKHIGYANASKFSAAFKRVYGYSPDEYRKNYF